MSKFYILSHNEMYDKYTNNYSGSFKLVDDAIKLYSKKYEDIHSIPPDNIEEWLTEYESEDDKIITDKILIDVFITLGSKSSVVYSKSHYHFNEFNLWEIPIKYKDYYYVKTYNDGSIALKIDYNHYKLNIIRQLVAANDFEKIKNILYEINEEPIHKLI